MKAAISNMQMTTTACVAIEVLSLVLKQSYINKCSQCEINSEMQKFGGYNYLYSTIHIQICQK